MNPSGKDQELRRYFEAPAAPVMPSAELPPPAEPVLVDATRSISDAGAGGGSHAPLLGQGTRDALQRLLQKGVVLRRMHPVDFDQLIANEPAIGRVLFELGLNASISHEYGMAVLTRITTGEFAADDNAELDDEPDENDDDEGGATLLRVTHLRLLHSIVLMVLRMYFRERELARDGSIVIDLENLKDRIKPYWPLLNAESRSDRRLAGAIKVLEKHSILLNVRDNKDQREISPVITYALRSEKLNQMLGECQRLLTQLQNDNAGGSTPT